MLANKFEVRGERRSRRPGGGLGLREPFEEMVMRDEASEASLGNLVESARCC